MGYRASKEHTAARCEGLGTTTCDSFGEKAATRAHVPVPGVRNELLHRMGRVVTVERLVEILRELRQERIKLLLVAFLDRVDEAEEPARFECALGLGENLFARRH